MHCTSHQNRLVDFVLDFQDVTRTKTSSKTSDSAKPVTQQNGFRVRDKNWKFEKAGRNLPKIGW